MSTGDIEVDEGSQAVAEAELSWADASTFVATDMRAMSPVAPYYSASAFHALSQRLLKRDHGEADNQSVVTRTKNSRVSRAANNEESHALLGAVMNDWWMRLKKGQAPSLFETRPFRRPPPKIRIMESRGGILGLLQVACSLAQTRCRNTNVPVFFKHWRWWARARQGAERAGWGDEDNEGGFGNTIRTAWLTPAKVIVNYIAARFHFLYEFSREKRCGTALSGLFWDADQWSLLEGCLR